LRCSTTDKAASNLLAERSMAQMLAGGDFDSLHLGCDIHVVSRIHAKTFALTESTVTGVLRNALSLMGGTAMNTFRRAIRA
jgi:hypothetical protein